MKKILFILLVTASITSCKKNSDDTMPGNPVNLDNKIKQLIGGGTTTYSYDAAGRVTKKLHQDGSKSIFEYSSGKVTEKQYKADGTLLATYIGEMDNKGLIVKQTNLSDPTYQELRVYNNDLQLTKATTTNNGITTTADYFYSNGNCDSARFSNPGGWQSTIRQTFYTDKLNVLDYDVTGQEYFGHKSKNLIKTEQYFFSNGSVNPVVTYSFEYDGKGRVIKIIEEFNGDIDITNYTY